MTQQEIIMEGIFNRLVAMQGSIALQHHPNVVTHDIISFLDSQGVALKKEGELPKMPALSTYGDWYKWDTLLAFAENRRLDMLKAGYTLVEPLIEQV